MINRHWVTVFRHYASLRGELFLFYLPEIENHWSQKRILRESQRLSDVNCQVNHLSML